MTLMPLMRMVNMREDMIFHLQNAYFNRMFITLLTVNSSITWHN